jgi:hypothetical protein
MMLVTLEQAKEQVRETGDCEDDDIKLKIQAASQIIANYLQSAFDPYLDSTGTPETDADGIVLNIPDDVKMATLVMVGYLYRARDSDEEKAFGLGQLPFAVTALIYHRRPLSMA